MSCDLAGNISTEISRSFTFDGLAPNTPTASDLRLFFNADFNITLSTDSPEVTSPETIRYTTDGSSLSTCSDGALFSAPIAISATTPVKAIACDQAGNKSGEFSHLYTFDTTPPGPPGITGDTGKEYYNQRFYVQLLTGDPSDQLRYLLQTSPAANTLSCANGSTIGSGANIAIPRGASQGEVQYFYFISCDIATNNSPEISRTFVFDDIAPNVPTPSDLSLYYTDNFNLTLSIGAPGVAPEYIRYSTDGSSLTTCSDGNLYSVSIPIVIDRTMTVKAISCDQAGNRSAEFSHLYTKVHYPTLTTVSDFNATEDVDRTITFAQFEANADEADIDGDILEYELVALSSGTLTTDGSTPVNVGDKLVTGGQWLWRADANVNGNDIQGFTVRAWDGILYSTPAVAVRFDVAAVNDAPTLTTITDFNAIEDTNRTITFSQLAANADAADVEGSALEYELVSLSSGTLTTDGSTPVNVGDNLAPGGQWVWRADANASGNDIEGFMVKAWDGALYSTPAVAVRFNVIGVNDPPILVAVSDFIAVEDTDRTIVFAQFETNADESDVDDDTLEYELVSLSSGTLTTDGSTPVNVGDNLATGGQWVWRADANVNGDDIPGFVVRAWDGALYSAPAVAVRFDVMPGNDPPTLTTVNDFSATEDIDRIITFVQFETNADAADLDGDILEYELVALSSGTLTTDRKSTRLNSSHSQQSRMPSSA